MCCDKKSCFINKQIGLSGSYTVEAAFIVPIVLGIIFAMFFMLFYLHDKVILYANIREKTVETAQENISYSSDELWISDMQKYLWMMSVKSGSVSEDKIYVNAKVLAEKKIKLPLISRYMDTNLKLSYKIKYMKVHPEKMVRTREILEKDTKKDNVTMKK